MRITCVYAFVSFNILSISYGWVPQEEYDQQMSSRGLPIRNTDDIAARGLLGGGLLGGTPGDQNLIDLQIRQLNYNPIPRGLLGGLTNALPVPLPEDDLLNSRAQRREIVPPGDVLYSRAQRRDDVMPRGLLGGLTNSLPVPLPENDLLNSRAQRRDDVVPRGLLGVNVGNYPDTENDLINLQVLPRGLLGINVGNNLPNDDDLINLQVRQVNKPATKRMADFMERSLVNDGNIMERGLLNVNVGNNPQDSNDLIDLQVRGLPTTDDEDNIASRSLLGGLLGNDPQDDLINLQVRQAGGPPVGQAPSLLSICHVVKTLYGNDAPRDPKFKRACIQALEDVILTEGLRDVWGDALKREASIARNSLRIAVAMRRSSDEVIKMRVMLRRLEQESDEFQENLIWARSLLDKQDDAVAKDILNTQMQRKQRQLTGRSLPSDGMEKAKDEQIAAGILSRRLQRDEDQVLARDLWGRRMQREDQDQVSARSTWWTAMDDYKDKNRRI